ncbi:MAG: hypothetical protein R2912_05625 [Eubacteriales bacterium]
MDLLISCEDAMAFLPELRLPPDRLTPTKNGLETRTCRTTRTGLCESMARERFSASAKCPADAFA